MPTICSRPCGAGRCVKPNLCLCDGGTISTQCSTSSGRGSDGRPGSKPEGGNNGIIGTGSNGGGLTSSGGSSSSQSCQITCLNGGTCINNKCICRAGYQGEYCGELMYSNCIAYLLQRFVESLASTEVVALDQIVVHVFMDLLADAVKLQYYATSGFTFSKVAC
ncbi:Fibrillin-2 [Orchesella cincta]|uniref:Fibrillin-2 n=1 Tax=Orchesella cincta TaxID=48709 RepID=A0A1D2MI16_ORCCI|nr:Fibrillin-2 [Orchesella cincta]